ncbi:hypothetical protein M413DRAFT_26638 [Hebeloma cylindrosporum]|uniref:Uncharacterized protein n=1 Tax=Hebeloma cylindrosporum TaxID=76867 RepID=A0A0C3CEK5_HEBCY|nr:hypothetical protein M413DRAFT_26638 [Hebeloma cylindrosporum h7]
MPYSLTNNLTPDDIASLRIRVIRPYVTLAALTWVIHDYCECGGLQRFTVMINSEVIDGDIVVTLEDEVTHYWVGDHLIPSISRRPGVGAYFFYWMRYYTIFLVLFDTLDFRVFPGPKTTTASAVLTVISLWSVEVIMQVRIYILYNRSKRVAFVNGTLFVISIGFFVWVKVDNALHAIGRRPQRGNCSNGDTRWAQWLPATVFELVLFGMAVYKSLVSYAAKVKLNGRLPLSAILLHGNIVYFFVVACVLVLSNLMLVCATHIPYMGLGLFHATLGIATCRMLIHLRKFSSENLEGGPAEGPMSLPNIEVDLHSAEDVR